MNKVFISHAHKDTALAQDFKQAIQTLSHGGVRAWYSSDESGNGGIRPIQFWMDEVGQQLEEAKAVIAVVTPASLNRPWILFEAGYGVRQKETALFPVCVGVSINDLNQPLSLYNSFQLQDRSAVTTFLVKILAHFGYEVDANVARPVADVLYAAVSTYISNIVKPGEAIAEVQGQTEDLLTSIKEHLDTRIMDILSAINRTTQDSVSWSISVEVEGDQKELQISRSLFVADVLNSVWFLLGSKVEPFTYMETWIIRNAHGEYLSIKDFQSTIPAFYIFVPGSKWIVDIFHSQTDDGPRRPQVSGENELIRRLKKIDLPPAKKYRQMSGE